MSFSKLVLVGLMRNKLRTGLTFLSITVALFLFSALGGILDTLADSIRVGSESRLVARNAISLVFPLPLSYRDQLLQVDGVKAVSYSNWFGGRDPVDRGGFFAQFAVDAETYMPMYDRDVEIVSATPAFEIGAEYGESGKTLYRPYLSVGATVFGDNDFSVSAKFEGTPSGVAPFAVASEFDDVLGVVSAGVDILSQSGVNLRVGYTGRFGERTEEHSGGLKLSIDF